MKSIVFSSLVFLSILGLALLQYRLLRAGIFLEKKRLDQRIEMAMGRVEAMLDTMPELRGRVIRLYQLQGQSLASPELGLPRVTSDSLYQMLRKQLLRQDIRADFSFAAFAEFASSPFLSSASFDAHAHPSSQFQTTLRGQLVRDCHCRIDLVIQVPNAFKYLLGQLSGLIFWSVAFVVLLLGGLVFFMLQIRKLHQLDVIKNDFINHLAHELKTPVFSSQLLISLTQKALAAQNLEKAQEYLIRLEQENKHIGSQVEKVLELASLEGGQYHLELTRLNLADMLTELAGQYQALAQQAGGSLNLDVPDVPLPLLLADRVHLRNAIANLLDNALKYGGQVPKITLGLAFKDKKLEISVKDEGPGIAAAQQQHVFKKFFRVVNPGQIPPAKGFGLGLSYVRQIALAHSGTVAVKSEPGKGASFFISIPIVE